MRAPRESPRLLDTTSGMTEIAATFLAPDISAPRGWLERHHSEKKEIGLVLLEGRVDEPSVTYDEALDEALAFSAGWTASSGASPTAHTPCASRRASRAPCGRGTTWHGSRSSSPRAACVPKGQPLSRMRSVATGVRPGQNG